MWMIVCILVSGYLIGSIPAGYIAGRIRGIDIRQHGSGNIGATNAVRVLGKAYGYTVFFVDVLKGLAAVRVAMWLARYSSLDKGDLELLGIFAAVACVLGHSFPVWLKFRGGKGVATSAGVLLGLAPWAALIAFLVWVVVFQVTRYVSLASIISAAALPITVALLMRLDAKPNHGRVLLYLSTGVTAVVILRHRSNIARLMNGTEQRFSRK